MKNEQRVTKNRQGRLWSTISTKIEGYDFNFKRYSKEKAQKKLKYKNNESLRYKTPLNPV